MTIPEPVLSAQVQHIHQDTLDLARQMAEFAVSLSALLESAEAVRHQATAAQRRLMELNTASPEGIPNTAELGRALRRFQEIGRQLETVAEPLHLNLPELARLVQDTEVQLQAFVLSHSELPAKT